MKLLKSISLMILLSTTATALSQQADQSSTLIWKRADLLKRTLSQALALDEAELCLELDSYSCFDYVHQYSLGGHNAEDLGQFQGQPAPSITTAVAFERVILTSCENRVRKDLNEAEQRRFFSHLDLTIPVDSLTDSQILEQTRDVYQAFLRRLPSTSQETTILEMARNPLLTEQPSSELAKLLCFTIGSQAEFLFF